MSKLDYACCKQCDCKVNYIGGNEENGFTYCDKCHEKFYRTIARAKQIFRDGKDLRDLIRQSYDTLLYLQRELHSIHGNIDLKILIGDCFIEQNLIRKSLVKAGVLDLAALIELTLIDVKKIDGIGNKSADQIRQALAEMRLCLKDDEDFLSEYLEKYGADFF